MAEAYRDILARRVERTRAFHASSEPGDLLVIAFWARGASLEGYLCRQFHERPVADVLDAANVPGMIETYVAELRESFAEVARYDDDAIPSALVYWGIGCIAAAMCGQTPFHDEMTSWCEPNLSWEQIDSLRFDPENPWVRFAVDVNRALWACWDGDFHVLPYLHRSPLDAANGLRGTALFEEMYTDPHRVHRLIDWCADWQLSIEQRIATEAPPAAPSGWGNAVWGTWLPDGGVFVNGDPVGLISREMALEFERPYTAKFFAGTGGGFYHNHTVGLYQADIVSATPGTLVQWFVNDPKHPSGADALLDHPEHRQRLLRASLDAPIALAPAMPDRLDEMLDIARHGRFILVLGATGETDDAETAEMIAKVRAVSNLG